MRALTPVLILVAAFVNVASAHSFSHNVITMEIVPVDRSAELPGPVSRVVGFVAERGHGESMRISRQILRVHFTSLWSRL